MSLFPMLLVLEKDCEIEEKKTTQIICIKMLYAIIEMNVGEEKSLKLLIIIFSIIISNGMINDHYQIIVFVGVFFPNCFGQLLFPMAGE